MVLVFSLLVFSPFSSGVIIDSISFLSIGFSSSSLVLSLISLSINGSFSSFSGSFCSSVSFLISLIEGLTSFLLIVGSSIAFLIGSSFSFPISFWGNSSSFGLITSSFVGSFSSFITLTSLSSFLVV